MTDLEAKVLAAIDADPNYLATETDPLKWAIAWRLVRDTQKINAAAETGTPGAMSLDGWMLGWFANAMSVGMGKVVSAQTERSMTIAFIRKYEETMPTNYDAPARVMMAQRLEWYLTNFVHLDPDYVIDHSFAPEAEHVA